MNKEKWPSSELLNALVDGELCEQERREIYALIEQDETLSKQVCELQHLKAMVQLAYPEISEQKALAPKSHRHVSWRIKPVAASVLFAVLLVSSWMMFSASHINERLTGVSPSAVSSGRISAQRIILHLTTSDAESIHGMLYDIENLFNDSLRSNNKLEIQVIAHGDGLNLLRSDTSPYPELIKALSARYDRLTFTACQNTIDRLRQDYGISVQLLPEAVTIDSGVAEVIKRQQEGWAYIQV